MADGIWSSTDFPHACLKDRVRTEAFRAAIHRVVRPGDRVLDVGAGTGILSFFAVEAGATQVYAIEIDPLLAAALTRSVALNHHADRIIVVAGDAISVDLPRDVDVVIGELIETGLIDESQVAVFNALRERSVIGPRTTLIPHGYATSVDLVEVDDTFYGYRIAAPLHEWPHYRDGEAGWLRTPVRPLTERAEVTRVDLGGWVAPVVERRLELVGIADGVANGLRLSGLVELAPGLKIGPTNALNGDKILHLPTPVAVAPNQLVRGDLCYVMSGGLSSFVWRQID
jgi:predicted RNA methylase